MSGLSAAKHASSDRKSLDLLLDKLFPKNDTTSTTKLSPVKKPTNWLSKEKLKGKKDKKYGKLPVSKSKKNNIKSPSFEKYGIVLPTYEQIILDQQKFAKHRGILESLNLSDTKNVSLRLAEESTTDTVLDCKHLTDEELRKYFKKFRSELKDIFYGIRYLDRHEIYHQLKTKDNQEKLRYNSTTILFKFEQLEYLMDRLKNDLDPVNKCTDYLFKVLLPELCLLIFMDTFKMQKDEAMDYLNERPPI